MKIAFFNWRDIAYRDSNPNGAVVSIRNPGTEPPDFDAGWRAIHAEAFHDIDSRYGDFKLMGLAQALRIVRFIEQQARGGIDELAIHCHDGVSRSAAVAEVASERFRVPLLLPTDGANPLVRRRMRHAYAIYFLARLRWFTASRLLLKA
ncbi:hypothetical protein BSFA1_79570 (plasmid) [Burkholderia sp. SFA1]|uniref:Tyrosine specific protein phosphatases domain-containing protein n=1 Tax=Burkholderia vietnamiensis (strain G4 / LMG 22486) TaxID=269482 RepID=A4JTX9_BURVG|nr:hypothetical protein Bcep1808_6845 [Burkholderia vietnamiensis G4]AET95225.1 hypothetical protein BYI23_E000640 [Burkholderia sp. YI23]MCB4350109.1 hypothetical protein [Burkholderia vietnamiensis]BBQ02829.1 hypothetical protein BSFA1_79570 [Burkholderia sp. SFA1]